MSAKTPEEFYGYHRRAGDAHRLKQLLFRGAMFLLAMVLLIWLTGCAGTTTVGIWVEVDGEPNKSWAYSVHFGPQDPTWRCPDRWAEQVPGVPTWMECDLAEATP